MKKLAFALLLVSSPALADTWLVGTLASHHFDSNMHCERNFGLGFEHDVAQDTRLVGGFYKNSLCRHAGYAGLAWTPVRFGELHFGGMAGAASGYADHLIPAAAFLVAWEHDHFGVNVLALPRISASKPGVVGLQVKWRF